MITRKRIVKVREGTWAENKDKAKVYWQQHWEEVREEELKDLKGELVDSTYTLVEETDKFLGIAAETEAGELVGYLAIFIFPHHHHANELFAITDAFYIDPLYRGTRAFDQMINEAERILVSRGVKYFQFTFTNRVDISKYAVRKGFKLADHIYIKKIGN